MPANVDDEIKASDIEIDIWHPSSVAKLRWSWSWSHILGHLSSRLNFASYLCKLSVAGREKLVHKTATQGEVLSVIDQFPPSSQTGSNRIETKRNETKRIE